MQIRTVTKNDYHEIDKLIREAFTNTAHGYGGEAELVDKIRESDTYISDFEVIASEDDQIIGYGLLSKVNILNENNTFSGLVLAPLAVLPKYQRTGAGKSMINELETRAKKHNYRFISILGHPDYYPKFGYLPASKFHVNAPFDVPDEAFMIKPLYTGALDGISGIIKYSKAFE